MITQYTQELLTNHGWKFVPSHDAFINNREQAMPECWVHEDGTTYWTIVEVLEWIVDHRADNLRPPVQTSYFSFGQVHVHSINGKTFDKDCIVKITAEDPRAVMFKTFGPRWAFEYDEIPNMEYFPRGIIALTT